MLWDSKNINWTAGGEKNTAGGKTGEEVGSFSLLAQSME
jgi:hypothetical protein